MPSVIKLTTGMFPELHAGLLRAMQPNMTDDEWRVAFMDRDWHDEDRFGKIEIQAMLGL